MPDQPVTPASADPGSNSGSKPVFPAQAGGVPELGGAGDAAPPVFDEEPPEHVPGSFLGALPQFFIFPLILVVTLTAIYLLLRLLTGAADATTPELLAEIRTAGASERWFKLHELAQGLQNGRLDLAEVGSDELLGFYEGTLASLAADPGPTPADRDELRHALLLVMAHKGDPAFTPLALEALETGSDRLRLGALQVLGVLGDPASLPAIVPLLDSPLDTERLVALGAVAGIDSDAARDVLAAQLGSSHAEIARNAAIQLGLAGDARAKPVLLHLLDRDAYAADAGVSGALQGLSEGSRAEARDQYVDELMINACRAASRLGDPAFVPVLQALRRGDRSMKVKSAALDALHEMGVDPETT